MIATTAPTPATRRGGVSRGLVALAVLAGATLAALGAATGMWLGWRDAPPMTYGHVEPLAAAVAPGARLDTLDQMYMDPLAGDGSGPGGVLPFLFGQVFGGFEEAVVATGEGTAAVLDATPGRLSARGWAAERRDDGVVATRDGLHLVVRASDSRDGSGAAVRTVTLTVRRDEPAGVLGAALGGAAAGAVLGAAATLLLGRRSRLVRGVILGVCVVLLGLTVTTLGRLGVRLAGVTLPPDEARRSGLLIASAVMSVTALVAFAVALTGLVLLAGSRRRGADPPDAGPSRPVP